MMAFKFFSKNKKPQTSQKDLAIRAPRVTIAPLHNIYFDLEESEGSTRIKLANISASGAALFNEKITPYNIRPGVKLRGQLGLQGKNHNVEMIIVHANQTLVGCHFASQHNVLANLINQYFQVELAAIKLKRINPDYLQKQKDGQVNWFRGEDNCELYAVCQAEKIVRFNLSFFGNYIDFTENHPLKYGTLRDEVPGDLKYKGSDIIDQKKKIPTDIGESSIKFIANIVELPAHQRDFIIEEISKASLKNN